VLADDWRSRGVVKPQIVAAEPDLVVEDAESGFCGAVVRLENRTVELEDRFGGRRVFPLGGGFLIDGRPVVLTVPSAERRGAARTASGSFAVKDAPARVARASRIFVEGRHDAELVERVWGDDLRLEGVRDGRSAFSSTTWSPARKRAGSPSRWPAVRTATGCSSSVILSSTSGRP
jgi:hypothetical protein